MPRKTWDTKADFDGAYSIRLERYTGGHPNTRPEFRGNYERRALFNPSIPQLDYVTPEWERIIAHFGWPTTTSIVIIGAGFGWSVEYLNSQGFTDVWGVDDSAYIQGVKNEIDPADGIARSKVPDRLHDAMVPTTGEVMRFLRDAGKEGVGFDVCVTERVLTSLEDLEAVNLSLEIRRQKIIKIDGQIIHIENSQELGPGMDQSMNWKTLSQWAALLPGDIIVRSGGGEFL